MKLIILQEKLKEGFKIVERVSQKSLTLPILQNTLLIGKENFLSLETTNLEMGLKWWSLVKLDSEGEIVIPTHLLSNLVDLLPPKPLSLEIKGLNLFLQCGDYQAELKGFPASEFPIIPQAKEGEQITVAAPIFCQALAQVVNVASPSITRPEIAGVYFSFQKDMIKMVATDSFRLAEKTLFLKSQLLKECSLILPQNAVKEIVNIFGESEEKIQIFFSPNQILLESTMSEIAHPKIQLTSKLIEGEYPNYQEVIPKKYETQAVLSRNEFLNQIKTASIFSGKSSEIKLRISPKEKKVFISSQNPDLGEHRSFLAALIKGKEIQISFNHRFLAEGLLGIKTPEVTLELVDGESPVILRPTGEGDYLYVIMPIKAS